MRKIINSPGAFVDEVIDGLLLTHPMQLRAVSTDRRALVRVDAGTGGKVGIVTGGGSGHLPLFLGYVGRGLASGVAVGNVFSSPSAEQIFEATKASDDGAGVLYLYGNYGGDIYNFDIAGDMAEGVGIRTTTVLGADDIASAPEDKKSTRRGVAGLFFAYKTAGASADRGDDLDAVTAIAQRTCDNVLTMGVGLSPTILPAAGQPTFTLGEGEMEIGVGIHGEPGIHRGALESADDITNRFMSAILSEMKPVGGDRVAVLVNGLGATPLEELYIIYRRAHQILTDCGVVVAKLYIGEYATSLEMSGASLSVLKLDQELEELLDAPAESPFYCNGTVDTGSVRPVASSVAVSKRKQRTVAVKTVKNPSALLETAKSVLGLMPRYAEELRALDAALGDGDLGITVASGATSAVRVLDNLPADAAPSEILRAIGAAFASANPSTFAALIGGGLMAAGVKYDDSEEVNAHSLGKALRVMTDRVQERGGARVGDKTVVDVLDAVASVLAEDTSRNVIDSAIETASQIVEFSAGKQSQKGRAAWVGERSVGQKDPGQVAFVRMLEAVRGSL